MVYDLNGTTLSTGGGSGMLNVLDYGFNEGDVPMPFSFGADALHLPGAQVGEAVALHGVGLAVEQMDAAVRVAAAGEEHRHTEPGAVALAEVGAAGPDVLVAVQREAGDHTAALRRRTGPICRKAAGLVVSIESSARLLTNQTERSRSAQA